MRIDSINLTNFRGALDLRLTLNERINVFACVNGAGKSSVLDALALVLSWAVNCIRHTNASGRPIADSRLGEFCSTVAHLFGRDEPGVYGA